MAQMVAYEAAVEELSGATVSVGDGETYDIVAALEAGDGRIVLNISTEGDRHINDALSLHIAVEQVETWEEADAEPDEPKESWTREALEAHAASIGLAGSEDLKTKGDVLAYIQTGEKPAAETTTEGENS